MKMNVNVNGQDFTATLENNSAVDAFVQMMENGSVTLQLSDYAGFEKVGPLGSEPPHQQQPDHDPCRGYCAVSGQSDRHVLWFQLLELHKTRTY